jgi:hypothetical protein
MIAVGQLDQFRQAHRVLDRHAGALREGLQRRMRRVS